MVQLSNLDEIFLIACCISFIHWCPRVKSSVEDLYHGFNLANILRYSMGDFIFVEEGGIKGLCCLSHLNHSPLHAAV